MQSDEYTNVFNITVRILKYKCLLVAVIKEAFDTNNCLNESSELFQISPRKAVLYHGKHRHELVVKEHKIWQFCNQWSE